MFVLVAAVLSGAIGNVLQRQIYGPTERERAQQAKIEAAAAARDQAAFDRATKEAAVDIGPREFAWTFGPPFVIFVVGGLLIWRRWPHGPVPA